MIRPGDAPRLVHYDGLHALGDSTYNVINGMPDVQDLMIDEVNILDQDGRLQPDRTVPVADGRSFKIDTGQDKTIYHEVCLNKDFWRCGRAPDHQFCRLYTMLGRDNLAFNLREEHFNASAADPFIWLPHRGQ